MASSSSSTALYRPFLHFSLRRLPLLWSIRMTSVVSFRAFSTDETVTGIPNNGEKVSNKPQLCTADELHYVFVKNSDWKLALWRYHPSPQAIPRKHPLLLMSGVGTNAIGYDLSPECSFARHMCEQGFDTWVLEVRGSGLSMQATNPKQIEQSAHEISDQMEAGSASGTQKAHFNPQSSNNNEATTTESKTGITNQQPIVLPTIFKESVLVTKLTEALITLSARVSGFLSKNEPRRIPAKLFDKFSNILGDSFLAKWFSKIQKKLEIKQDSGVASGTRVLSRKLIDLIEEGQRSVSTPLFDLQKRLTVTMEDFHKQMDMIVKFDWDFDHYLEEDVPAAMAYIKAHTQPEDGKLVAVGHSMGGILLYSMLSRYSYEGKDPGLAAIVTLASSLDYSSSKSALKLLLPLVDPAQALNVPIVPLGAMLTAAFPITSRAPYVLSWLNHMISAHDMMHPDLLKKLVLNSFCAIPAKLLLQLASALKERGLHDRSGTFFYKDHIHKINVPVLAVAGDRDAICPPEAVQETVKVIPESLVTYKLFGEADGPHYAHYDLVGGQSAVDEVYPCIAQFLIVHDQK